MAAVVPDRTFTDPTSQLINSLTGAFGSRDTTTTSGNSAGVQGLIDLLGQQQAGSTPEGAEALIHAIFQKGLEQVPGLATTYANAAGARSSNNSPLALTMQDMMVKLNQQAALALSQNQQNAANTAGKLADSTKTTTEVKTPRASSLSLLPFVLANADKLKKLVPASLQDRISSAFNPAASPSGAVSMPGDINLNGAFNPSNNDIFSAFTDSGSSSNIADALSSDIGNLGSSGFSDVASGVADTLGSGASDAGNFFSGDFSGGDFSFNKGGYVSRSKPPTSMKVTAKGYADGGSVSKDVVNTDQLSNKTGTGETNQGQQIRGITYNGMGDEFFNLLRGITGAAAASKSAGSTAARPKVPELPQDTDSGSAGSSGIGDGIATGTVGNPASNDAAVAGMAGLALSAITGLPGIAVALGLNAIGVPNTSMNPVSQAITALINAVTTGDPSGLDGTTGTMGTTDSDGFSQAPPDGPDGVDGSTADSTGLSDSVAPGVGMGMGPASDDASGDSGSSDGSDGGGDGGGDGGSSGGDFGTGGNVNGPQGKDVIPAMLTDGEYVIKKDSVKRIGLPLLHVLNNNPDAVLQAMHAITGAGTSANVANVTPSKKRK